MKKQVKARVNYVYGWMEENPATAALVSGGTAAVLAVALTLALGLYTSATFVQKTACSKNPASKECAEIRLEVAKAEPLRNPCASYQRVTSRRGKNCDHFYVPRKRSRSAGPSFNAGPSSGGDAPTGSTRPLPSGPREGGGGGGGTEKTRGKGGGGSGGGRDNPPAPAPDPDPLPAESPTTSSPGRSADAPGNPEPKADHPGTPPSTSEAAGEAVGKTVEGAGATVEGVGKGVDCALRGSC